jgi:hypothetical protein
MTLDVVLRALRDLGAVLYLEGGQLKYSGPRLAPDDPLRAGIAEYRAILIELFTYAPGGRCVADDCHRLKAEGADHCLNHLEGIRVSEFDDEAESCRNENGICQDSKHEHFDFDDYFDDYRAEQADRYLEHGGARRHDT